MMTSPQFPLEAVKTFSLPGFSRDDGFLTVLEKSNLPFAVKRVFFVRAQQGALRGQHAHKACHQFMIAVSGEITVTCDDALTSKTTKLQAANQGLWVPPSIWASQVYETSDAVLFVACDLEYDENDYIRDYAQYRDYRANP